MYTPLGELKGEDERREGGGRREREEGEVSWTRTRLTILQNILEYFEQRHMTFEGSISVAEKEEVIRFARYRQIKGWSPREGKGRAHTPSVPQRTSSVWRTLRRRGRCRLLGESSGRISKRTSTSRSFRLAFFCGWFTFRRVSLVL